MLVCSEGRRRIVGCFASNMDSQSLDVKSWECERYFRPCTVPAFRASLAECNIGDRIAMKL